MHRKVLALLVAGAVVAAAAACGGGGAVRELDRLREVAKTCPEDARVSAYVALDGRGAQRGQQLTQRRIEALEPVAEKVAACGGGRLKVVLFGPSPSATVVVFDDRLDPPGATSNARLLRIPKLVGDAVETVRSELPRAFRQLTSSGADPFAQLVLAHDFAYELGEGSVLLVVIQTSGVTRVATPTLTPAKAEQLAEEVDVPDLGGHFVTVAGLGRVGSGPPLSTELVAGVRAYYSAVCERTNATCRAVSDIVVRS
jgi:hypothetical protein